jgi:hypothetical protein
MFLNKPKQDFGVFLIYMKLEKALWYGLPKFIPGTIFIIRSKKRICVKKFQVLSTLKSTYPYIIL